MNKSSRWNKGAHKKSHEKAAAVYDRKGEATDHTDGQLGVAPEGGCADYNASSSTRNHQATRRPECLYPLGAVSPPHSVCGKYMDNNLN